MLRRKIESLLLEWKNTPEKKPLVIKGIRQCGKTFIAKDFAYRNYRSVVYMNFTLEPDKTAALLQPIWRPITKSSRIDLMLN